MKKITRTTCVIDIGTIAKILGIDDSKLKDVPYYPYDLVHYADN
ncbi:PoNe immunity protein domain-containing protein [Treponema sp. C6A8]